MDTTDGHRQFSVSCFNEVWGLLDRTDRSSADDELMCQTAHASLFHWLKRADCEPVNLSIGYWQLSRVYAVLHNGPGAADYAARCVHVSRDLAPFFVGYGYEASARAALVQDQAAEAREFLHLANQASAQVDDTDDRSLLQKDLDELAEASAV